MAELKIRGYWQNDYMLSKTAENLYWAARYIERADSIARLLEVAYRIHLIPNATTSYNNEWDSILQTLRIKEEYLEKNKVIKKEKIEFFLLFDIENQSSIFNCINRARENAKMVRTAITLEVWDAINITYHDLETYSKKKYNSKDLPEIIDLVKKQVNLIRGTILNTQLVNDSYDFLSLGTHFERADFTARIIDVKYFILLPNSELIGKDYDNFQWSLLLRAVSSFRGFKWAYGNSDIGYYKIIDFLILNMMCPRSLFYSIEKIDHHLKRLKKFYKKKSKAEELANTLHANFNKLTVNNILDSGLHEFLERFIIDLSEIYGQLESKYFLGAEK